VSARLRLGLSWKNGCFEDHGSFILPIPSTGPRFALRASEDTRTTVENLWETRQDSCTEGANFHVSPHLAEVPSQVSQGLLSSNRPQLPRRLGAGVPVSMPGCICALLRSSGLERWLSGTICDSSGQ